MQERIRYKQLQSEDRMTIASMKQQVSKLIVCPRHGHSTQLPLARGQDRRGQIPEMARIHVRPPEVADRVMPGHWEGDSIRGAGNKFSVGVLDDVSAESALAGFTAMLNCIAVVKVYCRVLHSPWQGGTCENTNDLPRKYLPKGTTPSPTA